MAGPSVAVRNRSPWRLRSALAVVLMAFVVQVAWLDRDVAVEARGGSWTLAPDELDALTIPEIQDRMAAGDLSSVRLTLSYLARIRDVNDELHAVIKVNPLAMVQAVDS